jgi:hypothetical protein
MLLTGGASYRGFFVEKRVLSWLSSFLGLMFPDGVYTSCIEPGSPRPCMSWRPGNPRHLSVDSIRASALLGPVSVPPHGWPESPLRHERGEGFGAWGLVGGDRDQRGVGAISGPVASLPHMEPSRCPAGAISGDTSVALELSPATHVGGTETGPNRADARRSLKATMHGLELSPHAWWLFR